MKEEINYPKRLPDIIFSSVPKTFTLVPKGWHKYIKKGVKQQPDLLAIFILADIMYSNPSSFGYMQKSYREYSEQLGFPKATIKVAIDNLIAGNFIVREFRNHETEEGLICCNVMYIKPIIENISRITTEEDEDDESIC